MYLQKQCRTRLYFTATLSLCMALAACSSAPKLQHTSLADLHRTTSRRLAANVGYPGVTDYTTIYPTLSKLCVAAKDNYYEVNIGSFMEDATTSVSLALKCYVNIDPNKPSISFALSVYKGAIAGHSAWREDMDGSLALVLGSVKGNTTADLVFHSQDAETIVEHLILSLNGAGQPLNTSTNFTGTVDPQTLVASGEDPSQYVSGFYAHETAGNTLDYCIIGARYSVTTGVTDCLTTYNGKNPDRIAGVLVGSPQIQNAMPEGLGWQKSPFGNDPNFDAGRVDFQKSFSELGAFLAANYADPTFDVSGAITEAKKALQKAANN